MPIDSGNLALKGLDDLFSTEEKRQEEQREQVQQIPIDALHPFTNHPFKVLDDEAMTRTVESIAQYGVLAPLIARPRPDGDGYEIISGHRRQYAAKLAGLDTLPVIVRQMSDDAAVILMVDSNLQREHILPSERALVYKMKLEAIKNQGARSDLTWCLYGRELHLTEERKALPLVNSAVARNTQSGKSIQVKVSVEISDADSNIEFFRVAHFKVKKGATGNNTISSPSSLSVTITPQKGTFQNTIVKTGADADIIVKQYFEVNPKS